MSAVVKRSLKIELIKYYPLLYCLLNGFYSNVVMKIEFIEFHFSTIL